MLEVVEIQSIFSGSARMTPNRHSAIPQLLEKASFQGMSILSHFFPFSSPIILFVVRMMPLRAIQLGMC